MKIYLITGGAGFIGSNFVLGLRKAGVIRIVNLDLMTYAGNLMNLDAIQDDPGHIFIHGDIGDRTLVRDALVRYRPCAVVNFAAESHVDRSIDDDFAKSHQRAHGGARKSMGCFVTR
ncbi:MAG: GDP-mannose 4,6-dehydratase [Desulfatiglandaceae bacterium]